MAPASKDQDPVTEEASEEQTEYDPPGRDVILIFAVFFEGGLAPLSVFLGWLLGHPPLADFGWNLRDGLVGAAAAVPLVLAFLALLRWPVGVLDRFRKFCDEEVATLFAECSWSEIALVSVAAGVGEEMLFRGFLQAALCAWLGMPWGLTVSTIVFGLLHPISVIYVVIAGLIGLYLSTIWILNGNLLTVMVTHAVYDFAALGYLVRMRAANRFTTDVQ